MRTVHAAGVAYGKLPDGAEDLREDLPDQEADGRADRCHRQTVRMSACEKCMHQPDCLEQRGRCASFKTWKQWRKERREDIVRINKRQKAASGASAGDQAADPPEFLRRRDMDP